MPLHVGGAPTVTTSGRSDVVAFRRALRRVASRLQRDLPWLNDPRPWAILVSEVMLQQTSTSRVKEPWTRFLELFPTPVACANAPLSKVLVAWSGLGYPRRARALHGAARVIRDDFGGLVPDSVGDLLRLPGVGQYTAHAVVTFAFDQPVAVLDTNVGRVLARALANAPLRRVEAQRLADELLPARDPASFNQAMLDLGAQFCRAVPLCESCPVKRHCAWQRRGGSDPAPLSAAVSRRQAPFVGSNREQRGRVLRLLGDGPRSKQQLVTRLGVESDRANEVLESLVHDGLVTKSGRSYSLGEGGDHTRA
jgi:A/G-specific adenine glycosylase